MTDYLSTLTLFSERQDAEAPVETGFRDGMVGHTLALR